jgi:hypothetical protein
MKVGSLEIPDGVQIIISFPGMTQEEVNKFSDLIKSNPNGTTLVTNATLKILAKNDKVVIIEAKM